MGPRLARVAARPWSWLVLAWLASLALAAGLGVRFSASGLGTFYQYLDPLILRDDLARGLLYLHGQPPLFNLYLGLVLKIAPGWAHAVFVATFALAGLGLLLGLGWLARGLGAPGWAAATVPALFALTPGFLVYTHWLFYTLPVAALLVLAACGLAAYARSGHARHAYLFTWTAAVVLLTRSLFHPLWLLGSLALCAALLERRLRRPLVVAAIAPLLVVGAWHTKTYALTGAFAGSSWLGISLCKWWPLSQGELSALVAGGALPAFWTSWVREPDFYRPYGFFAAGQGGTGHPALAAPYKSTGAPNLNHADYARISAALEEGARNLVRLRPERYLLRSVTAAQVFLQPGPDSVAHLVDYDFASVRWWRSVTTDLVFRTRPIRYPQDLVEPDPGLAPLLFVALLLYGVWRIFARSSSDPATRVVHAFLVVTVLWVAVGSSLVEVGENDRMRWEVEPFLVALLASALGAVRVARSPLGGPGVTSD
jgi:hypothetical protein